jgi:NhaA family Na+:H+ antiporter
VAGLVIGRPVGIILFTWLGVRSSLMKLPAGVAWRQVYGMSVLAGIGFTMSLFVASLAFDNSALLSAAKMGILAASLIAGIAGWTLLWDATRTTTTAVTRQDGSRLDAP